MTSTDLFLAPIANNDGAKMKLAECAAHGMPFLATEAAMSGLPFLPFVPRIDLHEPRAAARLIVDHINNPESLRKLSESILAHTQDAWFKQSIAWNSLLNRLVGTPSREHRQLIEGHAEDEFSMRPRAGV